MAGRNAFGTFEYYLHGKYKSLRRKSKLATALYPIKPWLIETTTEEGYSPMLGLAAAHFFGAHFEDAVNLSAAFWPRCQATTSRAGAVPHSHICTSFVRDRVAEKQQNG